MGIEQLKGLVVLQIDNVGSELIFYTKDKKFKMYHSQECCEGVSIEEIHGDLEDLLNNPILQAEETTSKYPDDFSFVRDKLKGVEKDPNISETWTFYKLATIKGSVTIRWYGSSSGYYSESVDFEEI